MSLKAKELGLVGINPVADHLFLMGEGAESHFVVLAADDGKTISQKLAEARKVGGAPPFEERLGRNGQVGRYYKVEDVLEWAIHNEGIKKVEVRRPLDIAYVAQPRRPQKHFPMESVSFSISWNEQWDQHRAYLSVYNGAGQGLLIGMFFNMPNESALARVAEHVVKALRDFEL